MNILLLEDGVLGRDLATLLRHFINMAFPASKCEIILIDSVWEAVDVIDISPQDAFDFVVSDGTRWEGVYTAAIEKFGRERVVVYSGDSSLVWRLRDDSTVDAYIKSARAGVGDAWKTPAELANVVAQKLKDLAPNS